MVRSKGGGNDAPNLSAQALFGSLFEQSVMGALKAFEDHSSVYRERVWRHRKKNGDLVHVKVVCLSLEFDGRPARRGLIEDLAEPLKAEERAPARGCSATATVVRYNRLLACFVNAP